MCSDRLDTDFPDIDLSQLDASDFDSVNCLGELQWCSDQQADASPASIHCSTADELFEVRPAPLSPAHFHHSAPLIWASKPRPLPPHAFIKGVKKKKKKRKCELKRASLPVHWD